MLGYEGGLAKRNFLPADTNMTNTDLISQGAIVQWPERISDYNPHSRFERQGESH